MSFRSHNGAFDCLRSTRRLTVWCRDETAFWSQFEFVLKVDAQQRTDESEESYLDRLAAAQAADAALRTVRTVEGDIPKARRLLEEFAAESFRRLSQKKRADDTPGWPQRRVSLSQTGQRTYDDEVAPYRSEIDWFDFDEDDELGPDVVDPDDELLATMLTAAM